MQEKAHYIAITGVVRNKEGKYLICKRSEQEKVFPGKWCFPGGKLEQQDFIHSKKDTRDHWLDIFEKIVEKEILEETGLIVKAKGYIASLVFLRPNGFSTVIVNMLCSSISYDVNLKTDELVDFAWVSLEEAKQYDLIENIWEQMEKVEKRHKESWIL